MNDTRVSVVIPSYNHERYIEDAVESVLKCDYKDLELIVIDDGSRDGSPELLRTFEKDRRFRLYLQENQGAHAALNRGLELSRGEILFILNSDDVYFHERISRLTALFDDNPELLMVASWLDVVNEHGRSLGIKKAWRNMPPWPAPRPGPRFADLNDPALALLEANYIATTSNIAFRRRLVDDGLRFQALRYTHDWDFILEAVCRGGYILVEEPLVKYRVHDSNTIREGDEEKRAQGLMRFEILWVVIRHAERLLRQKDGDDLRQRLWNSLPRFGRESLLTQMLHIRGDSEVPPPAYDQLIDPDHPFQRAAVTVLSEDT